MDGLDQDDSKNETSERSEVYYGFLTSERYSLEAFDFANCDFDARPPHVKLRWKEFGLVFDVGTVKDGGAYATVARHVTIGSGGVTFVGELGAWVARVAQVEASSSSRQA